MKFLLFLQMGILFTTICNAQAFNAKLKIGSKENIDVIRCNVELEDKEDGPKTFTASNGSKYVITLKDRKIIGHKIFDSSGKEVSLSPVSLKEASTGKTCQSCIIVKWPGGKLQELCNTISCEDMLILSKSLSTSQ